MKALHEWAKCSRSIDVRHKYHKVIHFVLVLYVDASNLRSPMDEQ